MPSTHEKANVDDLLVELASLGNDVVVKTYSKHGVNGPSFGVRYADLYRIQKRIKVDHELADRLWDTGNHDARILATLIGDANKLTSEQLDRWVKASNNHVLTTSIAIFASHSPKALEFAEAWQDHENEFHGQVAWSLFGQVAASDRDVQDAYWERLLDKIQKEIHGRKNRVRYSMLSATLSIGSRNENLKAKALAAAERFGKVYVDHGGTSCKTPDPLGEIEKYYAHRHKPKKK